MIGGWGKKQEMSTISVIGGWDSYSVGKVPVSRLRVSGEVLMSRASRVILVLED